MMMLKKLLQKDSLNVIKHLSMSKVRNEERTTFLVLDMWEEKSLSSLIKTAYVTKIKNLEDGKCYLWVSRAQVASTIPTSCEPNKNPIK